MKSLMEQWRKHLKEEQQSYPQGEKGDTDEVAKVIIFNEDEKILILKRASHMKWNPNKWDLPGGMLKKKESAKQAAKREVKEETDLSIKNIVETGNVNQITIFKADTESKDKEIKLDDENQEYEWVTPKNALKRDFVPFLKDFIGEHEKE
tara:strand:- start:1705 stop:2154 length:450 start_codon:yes stop_codon:yes gene_type:complete